MTPINPLLTMIAQSPQALRIAAAERDAIIRRSKEKDRNSGFDIDRVDEFVEHADAVSSVGDEEQPRESRHPKRRRPRKSDKPQSDDGTPRLDIRA